MIHAMPLIRQGIFEIYARIRALNITEVGDYPMVYRTLFHYFHTAYRWR